MEKVRHLTDNTVESDASSLSGTTRKNEAFDEDHTVSVLPNKTQNNASVDNPYSNTPTNNSPTFLRDALQSCRNANTTDDEYPNIWDDIVPKRNNQWEYGKNLTNSIRHLKMIDHKFGGYIYATKMGVQTPKLLFCGKARDVNVTALGSNNYVVKPLSGHSARGVIVVKNGVDLFTKKEATHDLFVEGGSDELTMVEELIESAHPAYKDLVPPDYKFHVYEKRMEIMWKVDRNEKEKGCRKVFDVSNDNWQTMDELNNCKEGSYDGEFQHLLSPERKGAMKNAVEALASNMGMNWMRVDMFDGKDGPVLGEFTAYSTMGKTRSFYSTMVKTAKKTASSFEGCVMAYLFLAHTEHGASDDRYTLQALENESTAVNEYKKQLGLGIKTESAYNSNLLSALPKHITLEEIEEFEEMTQLERCEKVMKMQQDLHEKRKTSKATSLPPFIDNLRNSEVE